MDQDFLSLLVSQILQVTILSVVVWCASRCFAKNRPHLAHALWLLVLVKCITPPVYHNPVSPFCWQWSAIESRNQAVVMAEPIAPVSKTNTIPQPTFESTTVRLLDSLSVSPSLQRADAEKATSVKAEVPKRTQQPVHFGFWLLSAWLLGVVFIAAIAVLRSLLFLRWLRSFSRQEHSELDRHLTSLTRKLGIKRKVRLEIVDGPVGPAVFGFFKPRIVLPQGIVENQTAKQLEPLLAHELIHLRRGDLWWSALQMLSTCVFWFHPLVWLASKMVSCESERSCDEETVASLGCCPAEYARCLLDVLEKKHYLRAAPVVPGIRQVDITSARLERVMTFGNGIRRTTPTWIRLAFVVLAIVVLPGAAAAVQQEASDGGKETELKTAKLAPGDVILDTSHDGVRETREYDISAMLKHLDDFDLEVSQAEYLKSWVGYGEPVREGKVKKIQVFEIENEEGVDEEVQLPVVETKQTGWDYPEIEFDMANRKAIVKTTKKIHDRIAKDIEHFSKFGFDQVVIETRFLTAGQKHWQSLGIEWEAALSQTGKGKFERPWIEQSVPFAGNAKSEFEARGANKDVDVQSNRYVQKNAPTLFAILDDVKLQEIISGTKETTAACETKAPTVVTFNGKEATVDDMQQRPFVTSVKKVKGESSTAYEPVISVIPDGTRVIQTPFVSADRKSVNLNLELVMSQILSVDVFTFNQTEEGGISIQVPEVDVATVTSEVELQESKTLALSMLRMRDEGDDVKQMVALVTCRIIEPSSLRPKPIDFAKRQAEKVEKLRAKAPPRKMEISSNEPKRFDEAYDEKLKAHILANCNLEVEINGHVDYEIEGSKVTLSGTGLEVVNHEGLVSGEKGTVTLNGSNRRLDFEGDVRFNFEGVEICCRRLRYDEFGESDLLAMEDDVSFTLGHVEMRADSVTLSEAADNIELIGNAKVIQNEQAKSFAAQKIVYDLRNETVKLDDVPDQHLVPLGFETHFENEEGQVLPTAYYLEDDVQYFSKGSDGELKTANEALPAVSRK